MKITEIYEQLITEVTKTKPMIAYHGSKHKFDSFTDEFVGGKEATDQEGPGIYFTTSEEDARGYGEFMYKVMLSPRKLLDKSPNYQKYGPTLMKLIKMAPDWKDSAQNWDENYNRGVIEAAKSFIDYNDNEKDCFLQVWIDFYRDHPFDYVKNMVKLGFDGIIVNAYGRNEDVKHIIVYNPSIIKTI